MLRLAVLVSGGGTNLQAILDAIDEGIITRGSGDRTELLLSVPPLLPHPASSPADAVQHAAPLFEHCKNLLLRNHRLPFGMLHEISVLAERAAEITSARKQCARHLARVIQQRQLLKSMYDHMLSSPTAGLRTFVRPATEKAEP